MKPNWFVYVQVCINKKTITIMENFDYTSLFDLVEPTETIVNPNQELINKTKELLLIAEKELLYWTNKTYKESNKKVFVGTEMEGSIVSVNRINSKRINNGIKNAKSDIERLKKDLIILENK